MGDDHSASIAAFSIRRYLAIPALAPSFRFKTPPRFFSRLIQVYLKLFPQKYCCAA
jgi:hypothetical protein